MRKCKKGMVTILTALVVSTIAAPQAMAANVPTVDTNAAMVQLRMEDTGPDLSKGILVEEVWGAEDDGTPYVERTYVKSDVATLRASGTKIYTKTKNIFDTYYQ